MGRKHVIPCGWNRAHRFVAPCFASQAGFSGGDLELVMKALELVFEYDGSAARGPLITRGQHGLEHEVERGNAHARALFDRLTSTAAHPTASAADLTAYFELFGGKPVAAGQPLPAATGTTPTLRC